MRLFGALAPLVGLAVANPLAELQARQLSPSQSTSCSITHTRSCSNTALQSSARAFCGSLGYGTTISTIRTTATVRQTIVYTVTSTTRIATVTAPVLTNTATSVRTSMTTLTSTTTDTRIATELLTVNTFGVVSACSGYTPEITVQNPEVPGASDVPTGSPSSASGSVAPAVASICSRAPSSSPSPANCGQALGHITNARNPSNSSDQYAIDVLIDPASTASLEGCALACHVRAGCKSFYLQGAPYTPACTLYKVDTTTSAFATSNPLFFLGADMDCFRCAALAGASSTTTTTTTATTTATTTTPTGASACSRAPWSSPSPANCGEALGAVRNAWNPNDVSDRYTLGVLVDAGSTANPEGCALACNNRAGCKSFYFQSAPRKPACELYRVDTKVSNFTTGGPAFVQGFEMACFRCAAVSGTSSTTTTSRTTTSASTTSSPISTTTSTRTTTSSGITTTVTTTTRTTTATNTYTGSGCALATAQAPQPGFCAQRGYNTISRDPQGVEYYQFSTSDSESRSSLEGCVAACRRLDASGLTGFSGLPGCKSISLSLGSVCYLWRGTQQEMGFQIGVDENRLAADSACYQCSDSVTSNNTQFPTGAVIAKRQATASQPACLKATNSVQITSACNCMIPSSTVTIRQTISSVVTSVRSITNTQNIVATTTTTPTKVVTTTRLTVLSRTRWNTVLTTQTTTETKVSVTSWQLQATPSAFYIVDQDMAFAEWPADADEIHYHVQYDWDQSDDEYAPTIFSLDGTQLQVADLSNVEGAAEGYPVVGQSYDGPGMQMMALSNADGYAVPSCRIEATEEGLCPIRCSIDGNEVNSRNGDGLWSLLPAGSEEEFTNYVLAADVAVDEDDDNETPVDPRTPVDPVTPSTEANCASPTDNGSTSLNCPRWIYTDAYLVNGSQPLWQGTAANFTDCRNKCDRDGYCRIGDYECARGICRLFDLMTDHGVINVEGGHKLMRASGCPAVAQPV